MTKVEKNSAEYIQPLNINGLSGRMLHMAAPRGYESREILIVYGHHSSLERWWGLTQNFNKFGAVTMPDLPGFGGMDSMYSIGKKPDLDNMADYLASFMKWRYKRRKVTIVGLSYGFLVATRMLQLHPELTKQIDVLISAVGFSHHGDFLFSKPRMLSYRTLSRSFSNRPMAFVVRYAALNKWSLRSVYSKTYNAKKKFEGASKEHAKKLMDMEVVLWQSSDVRTHWFTTYEMLTVNNCNKQVPLPVWHVSALADQYFDPHKVEQHMSIIFSQFNDVPNKSALHAPSVIATAEEAAAFIPAKLRRILQVKQSS